MDLSIITVTHDSGGDIAEQMRSVERGCLGISWEQIIADNASVDGTRDAIAEEFPHARVLTNDQNVGFAAANNQAAAIARGRYLLFLNPDMRVAPGSLGALVSWMDAHPDVGIAGVKLTREDGMPHPDAGPRRFPRLRDIAVIFFKLPHLFPHAQDRYLMRDKDMYAEQGHDIESVRGSFLCMRRPVYEERGYAFDPRYFIWFEDVDACREAKALGWRVAHIPSISCEDRVGRSFARKNVWWKQWQFFRSALLYMKKWRERRSYG